MIRLRYASKLARTKLKSKRGILITSVIVASILFAALIACVIVFTAAEKSAVSFVKKAGNDKYLVQVNAVIPDSVMLLSRDLSPDDIAAIKAFEKDYYAELRKSYEEAGIPYDATQEMPALLPDSLKPETLPESQRVSLNLQSPVVDAFRAERLKEYAKTAPNSFEKLKEVGDIYGATGYYLEYSTLFPVIPQSHVILDGKEDLSVTEPRHGGSTAYDIFINAVYNSYYNFRDTDLLDRYLLTTNATELKGVPVIISAQEAASLFGQGKDIGEEPKDESGKRTWFQDIQQQLNGYTYQTCSRNATEQAMLAKIQQDYTAIQSHKDDASYTPPALQYDYPTSPCGDIRVKQDTRTEAEKAADTTRIETQKKLGTYAPPMHRLTTFQIVGFVYAQPFSQYNANVTSYIRNLLSPQDASTTAIVPLQLYESLPDDLKIPDSFTSISAPTAPAQQTSEFATRILEFQSIDQAKKFLESETCPSIDVNCQKLYSADPYGSNYLILDEISKLFRQIIRIALPILIGLALIIMWFTISRIMTENRKETAVYRAMGATRSDIVIIYVIYMLHITSRIALLSFALGIGTACLVDQTYGAQLTDIALSSFGISSPGMSFSLFDLTSYFLWNILGMIFTISIIASIQPLIRNAWRPPIQDMREE